MGFAHTFRRSKAPPPAPPSPPRWRWCSSVRASLVSAVWPNERFDMFVQTPIASRSRTAAVAALRFASTSRRSAKSLSYLHISRRGRIDRRIMMSRHDSNDRPNERQMDAEIRRRTRRIQTSSRSPLTRDLLERWGNFSRKFMRAIALGMNKGLC